MDVPTSEPRRAEWVHEGMVVFARFLYRHSLTLLALLFCCGVLMGVDQVSHIIFHLPRITLATLATSDGWLILAFWLFVIALLSAYLMFITYLTPVQAGGVVEKTGAALRTRTCGAIVAVATLACFVLTFTGVPGWEDTNFLSGVALGLPIAWLLAVIRHPLCEWFADVPWRAAGGPDRPITQRAGTIAGIALLVLLPIFFLRIYNVFGLGVWQPLNGLIGIAIGFGAWILVGRLHHICWPKHLDSTWALLQPFGRGLWILLWTNLVGELIWAMAHWRAGGVSFRNYTIWCIFHLLFSWVLLARLLDWVAHQTKWPFRFLGIIGWCVVLYAVSASAFVGTPGPTPPPSSVKNDPQTIEWLTTLAERVELCPSDKPVIVVAASGGGSRAALFTALVYESLARTPLSAAGGTSRTWADQIVMISSVSGGSLASAYFCSQPFPVPTTRPMRAWEHSLTTEIQAWLPRKAKQFREKLQQQARTATEGLVKLSLDTDIQLWTDIEAVSQELAALSTAELLAADHAQAWLLRSGFADDMCTDFMAPLLRGVLFPGQERGVNVSVFWRDRFLGFGRGNRDSWPKGRPLLLLNTTQVQDGRRLTLGFPPVPAGFLARGQTLEPPAKTINLDPNLHNNPPLSLDDHDPGYQITLAEGVRLSANFPWGFHPALLHIEHKPSKSPHLKAVDGGVVDNTGIDALAAVITGIYQCAKDNNEQLRKAAARTIAALEKRGVLFLEIDSGANPGRPGGIARLFHHVFDPVEALAKSGYVNAQHAKLNFYLQFQDVLREQVKAAAAGTPPPEGSAAVEVVPLCNFFQYHCNHSEDVMTAWAIGPDDKAAILMQFLFEHEKKQNDLKKCLADLSDCTRIVQEYRHPKRDDRKFATDFHVFKQQKERFEKEQAVLNFAAATAKDALAGTTQQADQQVGILNQAKPAPEKKNAEARPAPRLDVKTIERVLRTRKYEVHEREETSKKLGPAKK